MATLNVGAGQAYATLSAAVAASRDGDVIAVQAGTYVNDFATISKDITIVGVGGMANFVATVAPPNGKGIFVTQSDVTIQNLSFSGAAVADQNGAGIRYEGGNLVIIDSYFHDNQMGLLANADPTGTIRIVGSEFADSLGGGGSNLRHNLYVGNIASLVIDDSYFHDAFDGHQIKSRAQSTTITNSRIYDGTGAGSYSIDLPNGGVGVIRNNVIQQGPNTDNPGIIHYGGESDPYAGSSLLIEDNVVVNDLSGSSGARLLYNVTTLTATVTDNVVWGLTSGQIALGSATVSGTIFVSTHPSLDTTAPWLDTGGSNTIFGTAGADRLVGTAGADTMAGLAGNDTYVVNHAGDVVIEANGQGADTVLSSVSDSLAQNIENLTLTGSGNINGTGNSLANVLIGNPGNNVLRGSAGNDVLDGGTGTDWAYYTDKTAAVSVTLAGAANAIVKVNGVSEDTIRNIEYVQGGSGNDTLVGDGLANRLLGGGGNDLLNGGAGRDVLVGGNGNDQFGFNTALNASTNVDTITDFSVVGDTIQLENAIFTAVTGTGTLTAAQFVATASGVAQDASDRIVYETDTGKLFYDSNGNAAGGAVQFATLAPALAVTNADFFII